MLSSSNNFLTTTQVNDFIKEVPQKQQHFLGKVVECFDESDDDPRNYKIKFNIIGLPDFQDEWPVAIPLGNCTRPPKANDIVFIYDICDSNMAAHTFLYLPIYQDDGEKRFTGIRNYENDETNGPNEINLTEKNYARFKLPNCEIIFDRTLTEEQDDTKTIADNTQGIVTIKAGGSEITVQCDMGNIVIKGKAGSQLTLDGAIIQTSGFSILPNCPYTGAPHCGNFILFQ